MGILGCGYNCENRLDERLKPWFNLSKKYNLIFSFVSARFKEYESLDIINDNTITANKLQDYYNNGLIQYLSIPDESLSEHEARNLALRPLLDNNCNIVWLLDLSDEYYTERQIENIIEYINKEDNKFYTWLSIPFKNYVFSESTYVTDFAPPRIFRVKPDYKHELYRFYFDNDVDYEVKTEGSLYNYKFLSNKTVPRNILNGGVKHLTWLDNEISHSKILYHEQHFKSGFGCSYKWEDGHLKFNENYYNKLGIPLPEVFKDE